MDEKAPEKPAGEPVPVKVVDRRWWAREPGADTDAGASSLKPSYVEELERQLADKDKLLQSSLVEYREATKDLEQARVRMRREIAKDVERARRSVIVELLEVLDNLDRSLEAAHDAAGAGTKAGVDVLLQGVTMVRDQFLSKLEGLGVKRLGSLGQPFDPALHDAVSLMPSTDPSQDGRVAAVISPGYVIGEEVLRPARVVVTKVTLSPENGFA